MLGVVFNTIVPILVFPYVSRVLGVDALGKYNFYTSAISYLQLAISFGVSFYGVREIAKTNGDLLKLSKLFTELVSVNIFIYLFFLLFVIYITYSTYSNDALIIYALYLPLLFQCIGADWVYIGLERQRFLLIRNIAIKALSVIAIFLFVSAPADLTYYVLIVSLGMTLPAIINVFLLRNELNFCRPRLFGILVHLKPLFYIFAIEILLRYLGLVDVVLLGYFQDDYAVGLYSMALKVILLCNSVMNITATALLPRASSYLSSNDVNAFKILTQKTLDLLMLIGILLFVLLFLNADLVIQILGGNEFEKSVPILKVLSFSCLLYPIINMFVFQVLYPQSKTKLLLFLYITVVIFNVIISVIMVPIYSYWGTSIAYFTTLLSAFLLLILFNKYTHLSHYLTSNQLVIFLSGLFPAVLVIAMSCVLKINGVFLSMIFVALYILLLFIFKESTIRKMIEISDKPL